MEKYGRLSMNLKIVHNLISTATITISKPSFHGDLILSRGNNKFYLWSAFPFRTKFSDLDKVSRFPH